MEARILRLNLVGQPIEWLSWREAVCLYSRDLVSWTLGGLIRQVNGGRSRLSGLPSQIKLPSIMACGGERMTPVRANPPLSNVALFQRDNFQCLYCGDYFFASQLSRDHVRPTSRGGEDVWENVVASCKRCNQHKSNNLLSEINMPLQALPYRPNPYEYLALINSSRILDDQMEYLQPKFKRYSAPERSKKAAHSLGHARVSQVS
jgi:5-methylcytosine-specific restriction endonuclease McrA